MDDQNTPQASGPIYQESQEKNAKWLWLLIILIIVGALVFAFFRGIGPFAKFSPFVQKASPTPEATVVPAEQSTPVPETLDKSIPKIKVLNGSGIAGKAAAVKDFLEGKGYKVSSIGNADLTDYTNTEVDFKADFLKYKDQIITDLSDKYSAVAGAKSLDATDSADIEVIVGSK